MTPLDFQTFDRTYQEAVESVYAHWTTAMQEEMALHCRAWAPGRFDFGGYLRDSSIRYYHAYRAIAADSPAGRVCDVGGFWGAFPLTLRSLGYDVVMTETLSYYGASFEGLFGFLRKSGLTLVDYDPFAPGDAPVRCRFVTAMALLEHYPHSPRVFLENLLALMEDDGRVYLEVPNIAYWPKRMDLLAGRTPLVPIGEIYESETPFIGHHHEYTLEELRYLTSRAGLEVLEECFFGYSRSGSFPRRLRRRPVETLIMALRPRTREILSVLCRKKGEGKATA